MKFQALGYSPFFDAEILVGKNKKLNEFQTEEKPGRVMQCFVPVQDSQRLKIVVRVNELMKGSMIDVVVDGVLRDTYLHQKKQDSNVVHQFETGIYKSGKSLRRGKFTVNANDSIAPSTGSRAEGPAKVGTIELRLYRSHVSEASVVKDIPDPEETNSYQELLLPWNFFGVTPDCDISLTGEEILNQSRRISCRRAFAMERPGHSAWSTLRFIYRTAGALLEAGLMSEDDPYSYTLSLVEPDIFDDGDPGDEEMFYAETEPDQSPSVNLKRKRDEVEELVDEITFGPHHSVGTPNSLGSRYGTPSKRTRTEIELLEKEVREITAVAAQSKRRAEAARAKLAERVRKRTELDRRYEELQAVKKRATEENAKSNHDEELYMRQLNNEESD